MKKYIVVCIFLATFSLSIVQAELSIPLLPQTYLNETAKTCFVGNGISRQCETASLSENWKISDENYSSCPPDYTQVDEPDWQWKKIETFNTVSHAYACNATFSKGSPIWEYIIGLSIGGILASLALIRFFRKPEINKTI